MFSERLAMVDLANDQTRISSEEVTRSEMASFIRKIAADEFEQAEWNEVMVNHYQDIPIEDARARAVEIYHGQSKVPDDQKSKYLARLADALELPTNENDFYFRGGAAGILHEFPLEDGEIEYEPYRSGSHYDLHTALDNGEHPVCEFMNKGRRHTFTVIDCPSYGRLKVAINR